MSGSPAAPGGVAASEASAAAFGAEALRAEARALAAHRHGRIARRTILISSLTLVSRLAGYAREILSAWMFGDHSGIFDAFITAWRVPNLFRRFLGEGALTTSLQTVLTEADVRHGERAAARVFRATLLLVFGITLVICAVVMIGVMHMPDAMPGTNFAWLGADPEAVRELTARLMPFVVLVCLAAAAAGALQVRGHFAIPALSPVVLNLVWIAALGVLALHYGSIYGADAARQMEMVRWLAWAALVAGVLQLLVLMPVLRRHGLLVPPGQVGPEERREARAAAWLVLKRSIPLALGAAVYQINVMVDGFMAESLLPDGAPTLHYFANRVQQFPMSLVAIAATSAVFPALAVLGQAGNSTELRRLHDRTQRAVLFVSLPASVGLFVLATPIIAVSFEHGAFGPDGVRRAADALRMLSFAILPAGAVGLVARTYYACGDFRSPVRISVIVLVVNALLNGLFVVGLGMDVDGLALATAVASAIHVLWLLPGLSSRLGLPSADPGFARHALRLSVAAAACGAVAWSVQRVLEHAMGRAPSLVLAMGAGVASYAGACALLAIPEWEIVRERLMARITRRMGRARAGQ